MEQVEMDGGLLWRSTSNRIQHAYTAKQVLRQRERRCLHSANHLESRSNTLRNCERGVELRQRQSSGERGSRLRLRLRLPDSVQLLD